MSMHDSFMNFKSSIVFCKNFKIYDFPTPGGPLINIPLTL